MSKPEDIEELIQQFQKAGLRELHVRCAEFEIHLSTDAQQADSTSRPQPHVEFNRSAAGGGASGARATTGVSPANVPAGAAPARAPAAAASAQATTGAGPRSAPAQPAAAAQYPPGAVVVRAPYLGTFYRAPKPGAQPYVEVGAQVTAETELCMIEVMKLFTALRAGLKGEVHAILAEDGQMVQTEQALLVLLPST